MHFITRLCVSYCFWKFVRWFDSVPWKNLFPAQQRTVKTTKLLTVVFETLPKLAGISASDYFRARRNCIDLSDASFQDWRNRNNR